MATPIIVCVNYRSSRYIWKDRAWKTTRVVSGRFLSQTKSPRQPDMRLVFTDYSRLSITSDNGIAINTLRYVRSILPRIITFL
jgi:hypothetical protein